MSTRFDASVRAYSEFILRWRWAVLAAALVLAVVSGYGLSKLEFDTTFRIWYPPDSPDLLVYDQRLERFGDDDSMLVVFQDEQGIITNKALGTARRLTDALWRIPSVKRVDSVANFSLIRGSRVEHESAALAVTRELVAAAGDKNDILVWDRATWSQRRLEGHDGLVNQIAISPAGRLYSGAEDRTVRVWDVASGAHLRTLYGAPEAISALAIAPAGDRVAAGSFRAVLVYDEATGKKLHRLEGHEDYVTRIVISADGKLFAASREVQVWDLAAGTKTATWPGHTGFIGAMILAKDGKTLYTAGDDGVVAAWTVADGARRVLLSLPGEKALSLVESNDGTMVVAGFSDGTVRGIPLTGQRALIARMHNGWVNDLAIASDGTVYSASRDRDIGVHIPGQGPSSRALLAHRASVRRVVVDDTDTVFSSGDDGDLYVWAPKSQAILARLYRTASPPPAPAIPLEGAPKGSLIVANGFRYPVEVYVGGKPMGTILGHASTTLSGLPVTSPKECDDDSSCGKGEYCDYEAVPSVCNGRTIVEAFVPGTKVRLVGGEAYVNAEQAVTVHLPADEPFSVSASAEAPLDPRARAGALLAAFPADKAVLSAALQKHLGEAASDPDTFLTPTVARAIAGELEQSSPKPSRELLEQITTQGQATLSPFRLPVQPHRLREAALYLVRGPQSAAIGTVINPPLDTTAVAAVLRTRDAKDPLGRAMEVRKALEAVVDAEAKVSGYDFRLAGDSIQDTTFAQYAQRDISALFPLFVGMVVIVLSLWYRRPAGVILPLFLVLLAIANTLGVSSLLGAKLNNMTAAVPQVVLACCVGDLNHVFNGYLDRLRHGDSKHDAVVNTMVFEFVPCFWTAWTTSLGFFAMIYGTTIQPIATFGWMGGIGAIVAWLGTFTVMPCILSLLPVPKKVRDAAAHGHDDKPKDDSFAARMDRRLVRLSGYVDRTQGAICFMAIAVIAVATYGITKSTFDTNSLDTFADDAPVKMAANFIEERLTGPYGISILVETGEQGGIRKVKYLEAMEKLQAKLSSDPEVTSVLGLSDIMKSMNRVMNQDMDENFRTPETDGKASAYYNAYTFSLTAGLELTNRVSSDESSTLIDVRLKNHASGWIIRWGRGFAAWAEENVPEVEVHMTGKTWLYSHNFNTMSENFFQDIGQAVLSISIVLFILARGLRLGIISMAINVLPLFITVGFTSLFGITLDISVLVSCSVAMGIVVDDTIHFVAKYKRLREGGMRHAEAARFLAQEHSKASIVTTFVLAGGFLMLTFTDYAINRNFGFTTAAMLGIGVLFDLFVLPAALGVWGPRFKIDEALEGAAAEQPQARASA